METPSTMISLGTAAPKFELLNPKSNATWSLDELKSDRATVVMFICNHCPYVLHIRDELIRLATEYKEKNIAFIAINSNDAEQYPDDSPEKMKEVAEQYDFPFPYLYDESQETAKAYQAACTPDFFIFDGDMKCVYRGQFDNARPGNGESVTGKDLRDALDNLIAREPISSDQKPSQGCNIKWKE